MNQSDNYHSECKDELIKLVMDFETADDQLGNIKQAIDLQEKEKDSLDDEYNKICDYLDTVRIQQITLSKKVGDLRTFVKQDKSGGIEDFINLMQTTLVQGEQSRIMGEHYSETEQETRELTNKILGVEESTYKSPPVFDDVRKDVKRKREERLQKSLQRIEARKNNTTPKSQQSPVRVVDKNDA